MSRKDYVKVVEILRGIRPKMFEEDFEGMVSDFIELFANDNPRFNVTRFKDALDA